MYNKYVDNIWHQTSNRCQTEHSEMAGKKNRYMLIGGRYQNRSGVGCLGVWSEWLKGYLMSVGVLLIYLLQLVQYRCKSLTSERSERVYVWICTVKDEEDKTESPQHKWDNPFLTQTSYFIILEWKILKKYCYSSPLPSSSSTKSYVKVTSDA